MNTLIINGKSYITSGKNIRVTNGKLLVDGDLIESDLKGDVHITFTGDLANLDCTTATIQGDVKGNVDCTTLNCGNIGGDVDATTVNCAEISGNVDATKVNCSNIKGNINL